jgi:hypothetical protein
VASVLLSVAGKSSSTSVIASGVTVSGVSLYSGVTTSSVFGLYSSSKFISSSFLI